MLKHPLPELKYTVQTKTQPFNTTTYVGCSDLELYHFQTNLVKQYKIIYPQLDFFTKQPTLQVYMMVQFTRKKI